MDEAASSRRRRGAGTVTANACTECRKKRSKCDGQKPCARCIAVKMECLYEIPVRQSKETMRVEIEALQRYRKQTEVVLAAISSGKNAPETLNRLQNGDSLQTIAEWLGQKLPDVLESLQNVTKFQSTTTNSAFGQALQRAESVATYPTTYIKLEASDEQGQQAWSPYGSDALGFGPSSDDSMSWSPATPSQLRGSDSSPRLPLPLVGVWSPEASDEATIHTARGRGQQQLLGPSGNMKRRPWSQSLGETWTDVTQDFTFVEHIMALYFCWEYPTFASLSKEHFVADFRAGRPRYCSSLLVNAMLALGCRFSRLPQSCANPSDLTTSGDHFFEEAKRLLARDDSNSLTTIQAVGLISIREASCGRETNSFYYAGQAIRLAVEAGLHTGTGRESATEEDETVREATFWGAFTLDQAWSLNVGRIPHLSRSVKLIRKPPIMDDVESSEWVPYTDDGVPAILSANQPSNVRLVSRCFCELAELVHQSLYTLYAPGRRLTSSELLRVYTQYLNWYSSLPEALRLGHNFTPSVLFAHMYYHSAILLLFRPFIKLRFIGSRVSPMDVCCQAADAIITLVGSYDQLYTLQRTPSFVPYIVFSSCLMHLIRVVSTNSAVDKLRQGDKDLREMAVCHGFPNRARNILIYFAKQWGALAALVSEDELAKIDFEKVKEACAISPSSLNLFCPSIESDNYAHDVIGLGTSSALFGSFPMQGLPLISKDGIGQDGFGII